METDEHGARWRSYSRHTHVSQCSSAAAVTARCPVADRQLTSRRAAAAAGPHTPARMLMPSARLALVRQSATLANMIINWRRDVQRSVELASCSD